MQRIIAGFALGTAATLAAWGSSPLAPLVKSYREASTPSGRAAIESYAAAHARDNEGALAQLGLGIAAFENKDYRAAAESLARCRQRLPALSDYTAYYLAAAQLADGNAPSAIATLGDLQEFRKARSPLLPHALILMVKARNLRVGDAANTIQQAVDAIRGDASLLPQPEGDYALALGYDALGNGAQAATYYQRVYFMHPATQAAAESWTAMERLGKDLGGSYPKPGPALLLERGQKWIDAKEYAKARVEFNAIVPLMSGLDRDRARVRSGAAQLAAGDARGAAQYLKSLDLEKNEADAERAYYLEECARGTHNDGEMMDGIKYLARHHERSVWRLKALVAAGNRYLLTHQPEQYEPLFRAAWITFPSDTTTAYCHWKITWDAYLANKRDAHDLLREQVEHYPDDNKAATALYFLGRMAETKNEWNAARAYYDRNVAVFPNFYYAVLARERLSEARVVAANADDKTVAWLDTIEFAPHADYSSRNPNEATQLRAERARLLADAGLPDFADHEVRFGSKADGQPHLLAVELASIDAAPHLSLRHMKILAPDYLSTPLENAPSRFWKMLFPLPYSADLLRNANRENLDPYMIAALIRQESEFNPSAHSYANAYGLTQIVPATGRMLARQEGIHWSSANQLYQPSTNLQLGAHYIRSLLDQWNGRWEQTLAAYNAGPGRVKEWMAWGNYREPAEFVESIPITQTREYVQAIVRNAAVYRQIYGPSLRAAVERDPPAAEVPVPIPIAQHVTHSTKTSARPSKHSKKVTAKTSAKRTVTKKRKRR